MSGDSEKELLEARPGCIGQGLCFQAVKTEFKHCSLSLYAEWVLSKKQILQKADTQMLWNLSILGIAAIFAFFVAWLYGNRAFVRPIKDLVTTAKRFGSGDMRARTCLTHTTDEIGVLAQSFDEMASLVETRTLNRRKRKRP